jgi:hypothetical protein
VPGVNYVAGVKRFGLHTKTFPRSHLAQMSRNERSANSVTLRCATERDPKASTFVTIRMLSNLGLYASSLSAGRSCVCCSQAVRAAVDGSASGLGPDVGEELAKATRHQTRERIQLPVPGAPGTGLLWVRIRGTTGKGPRR